MTCEKCHREFRKAEREAVAQNPVTQVLQGQRAWLELLAFERRTGPLVDEVVAAARAVIDGWDGSTVTTPSLKALRSALAALDEEAKR